MSSEPVVPNPRTARGEPAILLIDKAPGMTSHDVVARTRRAAGTRKVGHAGTLDPMATGLLVLGVNSATRLLGYLLGLDKVYTATIRLGASSSTDDAEGELSEPASAAALAEIGEDAILAGIAELSGDILQTPSTVSAIKVGGKRAYALAREGETVELKARPVTIRSFELLGVERVEGALDLRVRVSCSSGTYIRALARDLGAGLGVGGHLTVLRRESIGPFSVEGAASVENPVERMLAPADTAARLFPVVTLDAAQAIELGHGKKLRDLPLGAEPIEPVAALGPDGALLGLLRWDGRSSSVIVNFPPPPAEAAVQAPATPAVPARATPVEEDHP